MKKLLFFLLLFPALLVRAQDDSTDLEALSRLTVLSEVVIRSDLNTVRLLRRMKEDTTFYKAFRNLRVLSFTSLNDIKMLDKKNRVAASLFSKTRQHRAGNCRTMDVLEEKTTGDMYKKGDLNYFTAELYAGLFFHPGKNLWRKQHSGWQGKKCAGKKRPGKTQGTTENDVFRSREKSTRHPLHR